MIHPRRENDHQLHEQGNGTLSEVDTSEKGEIVAPIVEKTGIALVDSPEPSDKDQEHFHSKRDLAARGESRG